MASNSIFCPLCGSPECKIIRRFTNDDCLHHLGVQKGNPNYQFLNKKIADAWDNGSANFVQCNFCLLQFAYPFTSADSEFYNMIYSKNEYSPEWKWDFNITYIKISDLIREHTFPDDRLLEIGAGDGTFLKKVSSSLIKPKNIIATEYSSYGRTKIQELYIKCLADNIKDLLNEGLGNTFRFICMFQVLEHLDSLDDAFKSLNKLLKDDGNLFITVPNNIQRECFEELGVVEDVPPVHISRWNNNSFIYAGEKYGLKVIDYRIQQISVKNKLKKFIELQYQKKESKRHRNVNLVQGKTKVVTLMNYLFLAIKFMRPLISIAFKKDMGTSQWIHFRKVAGI